MERAGGLVPPDRGAFGGKNRFVGRPAVRRARRARTTGLDSGRPAVTLAGVLWSPLSAAVPDLSALAPGEPLPVCPGTPNCVCSEAGTPADRRVAPLPLFPNGAGPDPAAAWDRFQSVLKDAGASIESDTGVLSHAVFRTPVLRFPDDLFARLDAAGGVIHLRSSSRVGRSDLGANRRRVEKIRAALLKAGA